jgi:arylsulfatase
MKTTFIFCAERLQAVKWRNWKMHFMREDTLFDPAVKNPVPTIYNLFTDPREEKPAVDSWEVGPMLKIVGAFEASVKKHPLIPMGTPDRSRQAPHHRRSAPSPVAGCRTRRQACQACQDAR